MRLAIRGSALALLATWLMCHSASGSVVTTGSVTNTASTLVVGDANASASEFRGYGRIDNGSTLSRTTVVVGDEELYLGELNVVGNPPLDLVTALTITGSGTTPALIVGNEGYGSLNLSGSARIELSNLSGDMSIGEEPTGVGYVTISDPFTQLSVGENLTVGAEGTGWLSILDGARVITRDDSPADAVRIGGSATGVGTVEVDGPGSLLWVGSNLFVGSSGIGTLQISGGGIVDSNNRGAAATVNVTIGTRGRVELDGGTLIGTAIDLDGLLAGHGLVRGTVAVDANAFIEVGDSQLLRFDGTVTNQGSMTIESGEIHFLGSLANSAQGAFDAPGRITLMDGTARFSTTLTNSGVIASTWGTNNIHGEITNAGNIVVASDTVAVFHDAVTTTTGTIDVLPRGNALFLADATFTAASSLQLAVGNDGDTNNSAALAIAGEANLGGNLRVNTAGGFTPMLGQFFDLITADGGINGQFANIILPGLSPGLEFGVIYTANSVQLAVQIEGATIIDGDYNQDGIVDAADYTVWRDSLGATGPNLAADGDGNGIVDQADYAVWRGSFGNSSAVFAPGTTAVPEPTTLLLSVVGLVLACGASRTHRRRS
jgi:T5SS/PEP-CTERM-associated repeat protein